MTKVGPTQLDSMSKGGQLVRMEPQSEIWPVQVQSQQYQPLVWPQAFPYQYRVYRENRLCLPIPSLLPRLKWLLLFLNRKESV